MPGEEELRVSTLELFFDLVFVFTLTQLTTLLAGDLSAETMARVVLIFVVLFWMYAAYAWLTNQVPPNRPARRLLLILGMAAFLICALAVPQAFDDGGVAFGLGYLLVVLVHGGLYAEAYGAVVLWFAAPNVVAALSLIVAGLLDGPAAYALWAVPIVNPFVTTRVSARAATRLRVRPAHFVERHGLLLIVALGESVVAIGIGLGDVRLDLGLFAAAVLGLALAAGLWWTYFAGDEEGAERALSSAPVERRFRLANNAYFYAYIPMLLGVIVIAAGVKRSIGHVTDQLEPGVALALAGGVAIYLAGDVAFRRTLGIRPVGYRAVAAVAALGTVVLGLRLTAGVQLVGLVAVLVATLAAERRWRRAGAASLPTGTGP
ncbi:MAG TPA: low temperature requirement protein A [Actinomycetota bacterium]|nr:low temperature requirement protein A [Actinomycetota bacterium]